MKAYNRIIREVSTYLLLVIIILLVIGAFLPNPDYLTDPQVVDFKSKHPFLWQLVLHLAPSRLTVSWPFIVILSAIGLALFYCTFLRLLEWRNRRRPPVRLRPLPRAYSADVNSTPERVILTAADVFSQKKWNMDWKIMEEGVAGIRFRKGIKGFYASIIFHLLLVVIVGIAVWGGLAGFKGEVVLSEGQRVVLGPGAFVKIYRMPRAGGVPGGVLLELQRAGVLIDENTGDYDYYAVLKVNSGSVQHIKEILINRPAKIGRLTFVLRRMGYAPLFRITDFSQNLDFSAYVNLMIFQKGDEDTFVVPASAPLTVHVSLRESSPVKEHFVVDVKILRKGMTVLDTTLSPGERIKSSSLFLSIPEMRMWTSYNVVYDPTFPLIAWVMLAAVCFSAIRFFDPDVIVDIRTQRKDISSTAVQWSVFSRHYARGYNEINNMMDIVFETLRQ